MHATKSYAKILPPNACMYTRIILTLHLLTPFGIEHSSTLRIFIIMCTEAEMRWNFRHWFSKWQPLVQPMTKVPSKWPHYNLAVTWTISSGPILYHKTLRALRCVLIPVYIQTGEKQMYHKNSSVDSVCINDYYMFVFIYIYIYIYTHIHANTHMYHIYIYTYIHTYIFVGLILMLWHRETHINPQRNR